MDASARGDGRSRRSHAFPPRSPEAAQGRVEGNLLYVWLFNDQPLDGLLLGMVVGLLRDLAGSAIVDVKFVIGTVPPANREDSTAPARTSAPRMSAAFDMKGAKVRLISKMIDGTYPDTDRVIPHANDKPMSFSVPELRSAIRAIAGHSKHPPVVLRVRL